MKKGDIVSFRCNDHDSDTFRLVMQDKSCSLTINDGRRHIATTNLTPQAMKKLMGGLADIHEALARLWPSIRNLKEMQETLDKQDIPAENRRIG